MPQGTRWAHGCAAFHAPIRACRAPFSSFSLNTAVLSRPHALLPQHLLSRRCLEPIAAGELVLSWGEPFGKALRPIAPGEWIVAVHAGTERDAISNLQAKLDGLFAVVSLMTDSRVVLDLTGSTALDILARGSTVDFHPVNFGAGRCINTRLAGVPVMLACSAGGESVLLFADRSVGPYLLEWLEAASAEI